MFNKNKNIKQCPIQIKRIQTWQVQETCASVLERAVASRAEPKAREEVTRPSEELQWEILHSNSNLDEPSLRESRDRLRQEAAEFPDISPREFILKDNDHINLTSTLTGMKRKLQSYIDKVNLRFLYIALSNIKGLVFRKEK